MRAALAVALLALLALLGAPLEARAECGDGGDSGGGDSGGDGDSDSDSEPACEEVSPVVGHAICRRFGSWDASRRPAIRVSGGASIIRVPVSSMSFSGTAEHTDAAMAYAVTGEPGSATGGAFDLQVTAALGRHLYAGVEGSIGGLDTGPMAAPTTSAAGLAVDASSLVYLAGAAVAGAAVSFGDYQLRGEVGIGVRAVGLSVETRYAVDGEDCVLGETLFDTAALIRPRLSAQRWVTPWVSVGASAGTNLASRGETSVGLFVGGHLRAFR